MNLIEKLHQDADSAVSSVHRRSPVSHIRKSFLSKFITASRADLSEALLSEADLSNAFLSRADLSNAFLSRADLSEANLSEANLEGATGFKEQLTKAYSLRGATLPNGQKVPTGQKYEEWLKNKGLGEDGDNSGPS